MSEERKNNNSDMIDDDLYEEFEDEELMELLEEEKRKPKPEKKGPVFPKWAFWLIAIMMFINVIAVIPNTFSLPAVDFLFKSAQLSTNSDINTYQKSIVVVESGKSKGTGFSISQDGYIITNHHVIDNGEKVSLAYPEAGLFQGEVVAEFEDVDLALLKAKRVDGQKVEALPSLPLAEETSFEKREHVYFIGNPMRFTGIANEGEVIGYTSLDDWEQEVLMLDAPIYHGNSGSPVINMQGEVIAVVFATIKREQHGKVGLAIPISYYHQKIENLEDQSLDEIQ
ncbi:S1C family serine protease [Pontibacillus yanchengensis]|uniref:Peptidase S7 n=1 Tax=Pontibacillus yanchengensis Y32 TaxID=1385514 RepID=A0A0A2TBZ0_9BACI|nr:serine protease [Pontibacillus yanchengensis]KGP73089.1 peptidase S7 [Pontibacillus yanchengensis Y32]